MVYQIIDLEVCHPQTYERYVRQVAEIVTKHGGRYLARGGKVLAATGGWQPGRLVVIEFDDMDKLEACYGSPEYRRIGPLREGSTRSKMVVVEGIPRSKVGNQQSEMDGS
jgi:uncharacterized protein (DUF1330 family)